MRENIIRSAFHERVLKNAHEDHNTFVIDELGLKNGECRADIAVLNGKMIGYEIKTENDTLNRLPAQAVSYTHIFDKAFIIVAKKHLEASIKLIPTWWGVYLIKNTDCGNYEFEQLRSAKVNTEQDSFSMAQLLWKEEALDLANNVLCLNIKMRVPRQEIYEIIAKHYHPKELSEVVIKYLKKRPQWRKGHLAPL
jgi:hypothetical protein